MGQITVNNRPLRINAMVFVMLALIMPPHAHAQEWCTTATLIGQLGTQTVVRSLAAGPGVLLAGTGPNAQIWRSLDNGATWTLIRAFDGATDVWSMGYVGNGVVLAGTNGRIPNQIWRSTDNGSTWNLVAESVGSIRFIDLVDASIFVGAGTWIWRSVDAGLTWTPIQDLGLTANAFISLGDRLLVGTSSANVWQSLDAGLTWTYLSRVQTQNLLNSFYLAADRLLVASTPSARLYQSMDNGATWTLISEFGNSLIGGIASVGSDIVLAGFNVLYVSADDGLTWSPLQATNQTDFRSVVSVNANTVLFGSNGSAQIWRVATAPCPSPTPTPAAPGPTATPIPMVALGLTPIPLNDALVSDYFAEMGTVMGHVQTLSMHPVGMVILALILLLGFFHSLRIFLITRSK
jgi:hypothetical protein